MERKTMDEDGQESEFSFQFMNDNLESAEDGSFSKSPIKNLEPDHLLVLSTGISKSFYKKLPNHIISFDKRYSLRFLELLHARASIVAPCNLSSEMGILSDSLDSRQPSISGTHNNMGENVVPKSTEDWILGEPTYSDWMSSPGAFSTSSSHSSLKHMHRKRSSMSTTNSTCSDQSFSLVISQGMLQITWKNNLPHFVLSVDGKREIYVADILKANSAGDKCLDYVYTFHSRSRETQPDFVGQMTVSTSFTLSPNEIMETQFVLYGSGDDCTDDTQTYQRKSKKLSKKVVDVLRSSQSYKQRKLSKFDGTTNAILEESSWTPSLDISNNKNRLITNFELAAIVVKSRLHNSNKKEESGGWGLKFLKKSLVHSDSPFHGSGECSTSTDVIVPAGFHGGPRTRNGGLSSLLDRWNSGGQCECGGWDIGCPLTILNTRENSKGTDLSGDCKTIDIFIQGSKQKVPILKISNIHDGLFYIHFEPNLSALQSFAIAAAIIHSRDPIFRSKLYKR